MTPTISDFQTLLARAKRQYAMAIVATNDADDSFQRTARNAANELRSIVVTAESLVKIGRTQHAFDFLRGKV
jgi:hypothetical protein